MASQVATIDELAGLLDKQKAVPLLFYAEWSRPSLAAKQVFQDCIMGQNVVAGVVDLDSGY
jgi:hypothetical protein